MSAVALLAAMFVAFILQIVARYIINYPIELDAGGLPDDVAVAGLLELRPSCSTERDHVTL